MIWDQKDLVVSIKTQLHAGCDAIGAVKDRADEILIALEAAKDDVEGGKLTTVDLTRVFFNP